MKRLTIFINGNYFSAVIKSEEKLAKIINDLNNPIGAFVTFHSDDSDTYFSCKRSAIDGFYATKHQDQKPSNRDKVNDEPLKLLNKLTEGGDEWKEGA